MTPRVTSEPDKNFAHAMTSLREFRGYSQNQLAQVLNQAGLKDFYQTTVSRVEKGERAVRLNEALIIARVLGTDIDSMLTPNEVSRSVSAVYRELENLKLFRSNFEERIIDFETFRLQAVMALEKFNKLSQIEKNTQEAESLEEYLFLQNENGLISRILTESAYDILYSHLSQWTTQESEEAVRGELNTTSTRARQLITELDLEWNNDAPRD